MSEVTSRQREMIPPAVVVDDARIDEVLGELLSRYDSERKGYPFYLPQARPPQAEENLPSIESMPRGSYEHAMLLWLSCFYMRGRIPSHLAMRYMSRLYEQNRELFYPESIVMMQPEEIAPLLVAAKLKTDVDEMSQHWVENAHRLLEQYGGDPRKIFDGIHSYEQALERIQNKSGRGFKGFQEKMVSMIIYFYLEAGIIDVVDFPPPIDFHVLRLSIMTGMARLPDLEDGGDAYSQDLLAALRDGFRRYSHRHEVDQIKLSEVMWLYSSMMCSKSPANTIEPLEGRIGRSSTYEWPDPARALSRAALKKYQRSCGMCPFSEMGDGSCIHRIASMPYYDAGQLLVKNGREISEGTSGLLFGDALTTLPRKPNTQKERPDDAIQGKKHEIQPLF